MLTKCFLIPAAIAFTLAQDTSKENRTVCDKPDVKIETDSAQHNSQVAGEKFFDVFSDIVKHNGEDTYNSTANRLIRPILQYVKVANESCYKDTRSGERDSIEFIKLVNFTVRHGLYKDFVEKGGVACIAAVKDKISECVKNEVGALASRNNNTENRKYHTLWKMTYLTIDARSCQATDRIKQCTLKAMFDEGYQYCQYENDNVLYVGSLFEFLLERCTQLVPEWRGSVHGPTIPKVKSDTTGSRTTHALLAVLIIVVIMAMLYVCVRDCRAPRGPWRALNERISMSMVNRFRA